MSKIRTHYDNLKIARNAPVSLIRAAYKVLLQQHHPDKVEGEKQQDALRITQLIREYYDVLSDPIKRAEHDKWIKEKESGTYNEKQSYQKQENQDSPQEPIAIENNSGCFWIIGLAVFCFWIFSGDDKSSTAEVVQEKIVAPLQPKNDIAPLNSVKVLSPQGKSDNQTEQGMEQLPATEKVTLLVQSELRQLSQNWIIAHSSKDIAAFSGLYDDFILFYGTKLSRNSTLEAKLKLFKKYPDLQQEIYGDIQFEKQTDGTFKSSFTKRVRVTIIQKTTDYPAYLIFKKSNNGWKIAVESDLATDRNIAKKSNSSNAVDIPKNAVHGDFNGDGNLEYMWMIPPKLKEVDGVGDCQESICENQIKFSNPSIPTIKIKNSIGGSLSNLGDLNKNGTDEVGLGSAWFVGCWNSFYVWTYKNGNWIEALEEPITIRCDRDKIIPIEIDLANEGNVIVRYSSFTNDEIVVKSKSVKIIK